MALPWPYNGGPTALRAVLTGPALRAQTKAKQMPKSSLHVTQYNAATQALLTAINHCAPTGRVQSAVLAFHRAMEKAELAPEEILAQLCETLRDGLRNGDWPKGRGK